MPNLSTLSAQLIVSLTGQGTKTQTGSDYQPLQGNLSIKAGPGTLGTSAANAAIGGADELVSAIYTVAPSATSSIDLTSLTDVLQQSGVSLARVKLIVIRLLSAANDAVNGTAASSITIDNTVANALSSQAGSGWFSNAAEGGVGGSKLTIPNGGGMAFWTPAAAGVLVDGTHKLLPLKNNDAGLSAKVQISLCGGTT